MELAQPWARAALGPRRGAVAQSASTPRLSRQERLLVGAAHELRTPLTVVRGHLELLRRHHGGAAIEVTLDELARLERVVERMLLVAELEAGRLVLAPVDLRSLLTEVARSLAPAARTRLAAAELLADEAAVRLALEELLANALRHSARADDVLVAADAVDDGVEISVSDSGPETEHAERLFDCFCRAEDERGGNGGAGLGLAIVRAVADAHGGRVGVRADRCGRGSVWSLWLPHRAAG